MAQGGQGLDGDDGPQRRPLRAGRRGGSGQRHHPQLAGPAAQGGELTDLAETLAGLIAARRRALGRPILVGLTGPQGSGKSTLARRVAAGLDLTILSLDDFYLTRAERRALADQVHPLLATRGPPGTHDLVLLETAIEGLLAGRTVEAPRFDKAADDRAAGRRELSLADIVLLEGWCIGAAPQPEADLVDPINDLERDADPDGVWRRFINTALAAYQPLFGRLDLLIQLRSPDFETIAEWRWEQEEKLRAEHGGPAVMDQAGVRRFVRHYERITRHMLANAAGDVIVDLDRRRRVLSIATA